MLITGFICGSPKCHSVVLVLETLTDFTSVSKLMQSRKGNALHAVNQVLGMGSSLPLLPWPWASVSPAQYEGKQKCQCLFLRLPGQLARTQDVCDLKGAREQGKQRLSCRRAGFPC